MPNKSRSQRLLDSMRVIAPGVTHRDANGGSGGALGILSLGVSNLLRKLNLSPPHPPIPPFEEDQTSFPQGPPGQRGRQGIRGLQGFTVPTVSLEDEPLIIAIPGPRGVAGAAGAAGATGATGARGRSGSNPIEFQPRESDGDMGLGPFSVMPNSRTIQPMWSMGMNEDGTSLSNWFQLLGSWSVVSSAFFVNTGATTFAHLSWATRIAHSSFVISADMKIESTGGFGADNRVGFRFHSDGTTGTNGSAIYLRSSGALTPASTGGIYSENPFGSVAGAHLSNNFALDTYVNLKVVVTGRIMDIYVDNVYKTSRALQPSAQPVATLETGVVGLVAYNCKADFKNVKMWSLNTTPTVTGGASPPPFGLILATNALSAGDYTGNGAMTVTGAAISHYRYVKFGNMLYVSFKVTGTAGGTPNTQLKVALPNGMLSANAVNSIQTVNSFGTGFQFGFCSTTAGSGLITFQTSLATPFANWGAGAFELNFCGWLEVS